MKTVQPIREATIIDQFKSLLQARGSKYYIMFVVGLNTGLRVSDILNLKISDIAKKSHVTITEKKTGKYKRFLVNEKLRLEIDKFIDSENLSAGDYMIPSRKGKNKPITRVQAYRILNETAARLQLSEIGTHTMRKTFGYWHYKQHKDIAVLQDIFNHSSPSITLKYIGITQDVKDSTLKDFFL
ncbi:MAG: site-specific integrase [Oscillospiraceae bacterium]|nr:site-specific integrase [Oscillospiraceae bacterium]